MITTHRFLANCLRGAIAALAPLSKSKSARASKLALIAKALDLRIPYFYEGFEAADNIPPETESQRLCIEVARNFRRIANREHQDAINILVKSLLKESVA